jgi:hypothetical protein
VSVLFALIICAVNVGLGFSIAKYAFHKAFNTCLGIVLGSFVVRFSIVSVIAWYCLGVADFHKVGFAVTFVVATFSFLMAEIIYFNNSYSAYKEFKMYRAKVRMTQQTQAAEIPSSIF